MKCKKKSNKVHISEENISSEEGEKECNKITNGNYFIFATANKKKLLSIPKSSKEPGAQIEVDNFTNSVSKQFQFELIEDDIYYIKSCLSGLFLKAKEGFKNDVVTQENFSENEEYRWKIEPFDENYYYIRSMANDGELYMQIENGEAKVHAKIVLSEFDNEQKFMICKKV